MDAEASFSLRRLIHILFKRRTFILLVLAGTVSSASLVALKFLQPKYVASAQLMPVATGDQGLDTAAVPGGAVQQPRWGAQDERAARSLEILTGRSLAELVVKSIGADALYPPAPPSVLSRILERVTEGAPLAREDAAIEALQKNLYGGVSGKSGLIALEFHHKSPEVAARVVNELTNLYIERYAGMRRNLRAEGFVQEQLKVLRDQLERASKELEAFKSAHQITGSAKDDQDLALHQLSLAQSEANEISNREAELSSRIESLRSQVARARRELAENDAAASKGSGMSITSLREHLSALQIKEAEMSESYTAEYPPLQSIRSEIQSLRSRFAALENGTGGAAPPMDEATYRFLREELLRNESELASLKAKRASQAPQISAIRGKVNEMDRVQGEYSRLQQQVQVAQDNYKQYLASAEQARIGRAMDEEKIVDLRVVEPARIPARPERSKAPLIVALATFLGLVGGIGIALVTEMTRGTLETVEDVEEYLGAPVLASVPSFAGNSRAPPRTYRRAERPA